MSGLVLTEKHLRRQREEMRRHVTRTNPTESPVRPARRRSTTMPRRPLASPATTPAQRPATVAQHRPIMMSPRVTSGSRVVVRTLTVYGVVRYYVGRAAPYVARTTSAAAAGHGTTAVRRQPVGTGTPASPAVGRGIRIFASPDHVDVYCECAAFGTPHCPLTQFNAVDIGPAGNAANRSVYETAMSMMENLHSRYGRNDRSRYNNNNNNGGGGGRRFPAASSSATATSGAFESSTPEHRGTVPRPLRADNIIVIESDGEDDDDVIVLD